MPLLKIFLDASVVLSGLASPTGGSRKLFEAAKDKKLKLITSPYVIEEVTAHLEKLEISADCLREILSSETVILVPNPSEEVIEKFSLATSDPDDAHILAAAVLSGANILVSLDKKHILKPKVKKALKPILVNSPKEFWGWLQKRRLN